jgi:beta-lactamase regulating signal transducer with metallopeptidase domain
MSELLTRLVWSAVQVTLLSLAASLLYAIALRRAPRAAGAAALAGLAGCVALTVLAACPISPWPTWTASPVETTPRVGEHPVAPGPAPAQAGDETGGSGGLPVSTDRWWSPMRDEAAGAEATGSAGSWAVWLAVLVLAGAAVALARLFLGLRAVRACLRRSRPVVDDELLAVVRSLARATDCPGPVVVRETAELATAATVGWMRPVVLLPAGWRAWGALDRRAALAHELAHVRRRDYVAGLLARVAVAVHWYHPLLHWLAGRLRLQQEMAADDVAARCVGGRASYLAALARLALQAGGRPTRWPVAAMFSKPGTLMRRIAMLRANEPMRPPVPGRALAVGLVALCAVGLSALRGPARTPPDEGSPPAAAAAAPEPFDLSYLPPDTTSVLAVRPAALLRRPGLAAYRVLYDEMVGEVRQMFGNRGKVHLSVHDMDQIVATGFIQQDKHHKQKKGSRTLGYSLRVIRCSHEFNWKGQMKELMPDVEEVRHAGGSYFRLSASKARPPLPGGMTYYVPDSRTIVFDTDTNLRRLIERKAAQAPHAAWADAWKQVEHDLVAMADDVRALDVAGALDPDDPDEARWAALLRNCSWVTVGLRDTSGCCVDVCAECTTADRAQNAHRQSEAMLEQFRSSLAKELAAKKVVPPSLRLARELLQSASPQRIGTRVEVHFTAKQGFEEGLKACMGVELDADGKPIPARR